MMEFVEKVTDLGINLKFVDMGSGLGIPYKKDEGQAPSLRTMQMRSCPFLKKEQKPLAYRLNSFLSRGVL